MRYGGCDRSLVCGFQDVGCYWHKADMLNALTNVRLWGQSGTLTNRCLPISIRKMTMSLAGMQQIATPRGSMFRTGTPIRPATLSLTIGGKGAVYRTIYTISKSPCNR